MLPFHLDLLSSQSCTIAKGGGGGGKCSTVQRSVVQRNVVQWDYIVTVSRNN